MIDHEEVKSTRYIRVLVTGPYTLFNQAIGTLLSGLPGVLVAGYVKSLREILQQPFTGQADLVLLTLPDAREFEMLVDLPGQHSQMRVLLLSLEWPLAQVQEALQHGVAGYLSADSSIEELSQAIRQAIRGEIVLSPDIARRLITGLAQDQPISPDLSYEALTSREKEILALVCCGLSNKQIAQRLYLSVRTVENHLSSIYRKLGVSTRTEAAVLALQQEWVEITKK